MGYVAVKGGTDAIDASIARLKYERLKGGEQVEVSAILSSMRLLIDQIMSEASLYSPELAALALKQAEGSMEEAVFLLRAHRSTLPRLYYSETVEPERMIVERRISASFKDIPGGQLLGATHDYTHRLIDYSLLDETEEVRRRWLQEFEAEMAAQETEAAGDGTYPKVVEYLRKEGLFEKYEPDDTEPNDVTKDVFQFPASRSERLQILTRGQTGSVTTLGYASLRGYGQIHPTVGEVRVGHLPITVSAHGSNGEEDAYYIGAIQVTEVESFVPMPKKEVRGSQELGFEVGYGICYGQNETKAIAMSILDQCLEHPDGGAPPHDEEFVLLHVDTVESTGFISHLKMPHYVTFQSKLDSVRNTRKGRDGNES